LYLSQKIKKLLEELKQKLLMILVSHINHFSMSNGKKISKLSQGIMSSSTQEYSNQYSISSDIYAKISVRKIPISLNGKKLRSLLMMNSSKELQIIIHLELKNKSIIPTSNLGLLRKMLKESMQMNMLINTQ
jgi:hypothetical protein